MHREIIEVAQSNLTPMQCLDAIASYAQEIPKIVCLCGSTKFKAQFEEANKQETLKGNIVLSVGFFGHQEAIPPDEETKQALDNLHLKKIDLADEVLVINPNQYIGASTRQEIAYATKLGKPIRYLEQPILER